MSKLKNIISLCMIVKNEEKFLECAVKSAKAVMGIDDIVVVDTGSADATRDIAAACGARVFGFEWCDDFSAAKNYAARKAKNDIIFSLDADEEVIEADIDKIIRLMDDECCVGIVSMLELSDNTYHNATRLYNRKTHSFYGSIHENIMPDEGFSSKRVQIPAVLTHRGYLPGLQQERGKFRRNVEMLEAELRKNPDDPYYLYHLGKCYFNFNRDREKACQYFEKVLSICDDVHLEYIYNTVECYGYALINTGKYREALNLIEVYAPHYKNMPQFRYLSAHIYQNNAMFVEAVECYESCIGADMNDTKGITSFLSLYNIGVILECLGMTEDAIAMYTACGEYEPALERLKALSAR